MKSINLIDLQNEFICYTYKEHIILNSLADKEIKQIIKDNINTYVKSRGSISSFNNKVILVYHNVVNNGLYSLLSCKSHNRFLCSYYSFAGLIRKCIKKKYYISKIDITHGYGIRKEREVLTNE